jgi:DNA-binding NarL/FixJ family response regulator
MSITILLIEDHALMREALAARLARETDLSVVGEAGDAETGVERAIALQPNVILMDIELPGLSSFEATRAIRLRCPHARVLFVSAHLHDRYLDEALAVEAAGYVTKRESPHELLTAIRTAAGGGNYFSGDVQARLVNSADGTRAPRAARSRCSTLTPRELEVLRYLAHGMSQKQVASTMHLSAKTVHCHTTNIMTKLDIHDRVELARFAIREGVVQP